MRDISEHKEEEWNQSLCVGILAHVDAGKTTLSESILYESGSIRKTGRVDHGDAFLDTHDLERRRGITIFAKQALLTLGKWQITLLDTPGHVDFSTEMERTLQVLDYAVLVINGADGVQGHTVTLWRLLQTYRIPVFLFVNKMDQPQADKAYLMQDLKKQLDEGCMDFTADPSDEQFLENLALTDEQLMERYLETGEIREDEVQRLIAQRKIFPCYFGAALKQEGIKQFLTGLEQYMQKPHYRDDFGAKVFKISRDEQGNRLTHLKMTGGSLKVKTMLSGKKGDEVWEEKIDQIRLYSGTRFDTASEVRAGMVCAVTGLNHTMPGQGLGAEPDSVGVQLEPVLTYQILLPEGCDVHTALSKFRQLEEEEPQLHIVWNSQLGEIHAHVMGEVQIEILKDLMQQRFGMQVEFGVGNIVYKETITDAVEGVGHFEPLRHYAEVHLLMEPGETGSGLVFLTDCSEDVLDRNWQRLILTHLAEQEHPGVLTGSAITDMRITLIGGKAHLKHTEGGDFRQATYRAVRQGLKEADCMAGACQLLEPWYQFRLEVPGDQLGRAMADIQRMSGVFESPLLEEDMAILEGSAPVSKMREYQREVVSYTKGRGRLFCQLKGYEPCHNEQEVLEQMGYDSETDTDHPTGSVFCAHGAGYTVSWDKVKEQMHVPCLKKMTDRSEETDQRPETREMTFEEAKVTNQELEEIFLRTYGPGKRKPGVALQPPKTPKKEPAPPRYKKQKTLDEYLLVDGYNIIFAWEELKELAQVSIDGARDKLIDRMCNYQGYKKCTLILVFDAYRLEGHQEEVLKHHNIYVVYTKEAETADQYIEKTVHAIGKKYNVTVATSDGLEQMIIRGEGGRLLSAREFQEEVELVRQEIRQEFLDKRHNGRNYLFNYLDEETAREMEQKRLGKDTER